MTPPPTPITRLRLGQAITVHGQHGIVVGIIDYFLVPGEKGQGVWWLPGGSAPVQFETADVVPVLRGLDSLTEDECREVFKLAFGYWDGIESVSAHRHFAYIELSTGRLQLLITSQGTVVAQKEHGGKMGYCARFNPVAVIDYLDSLGVAIRGETR